MYNWQSAVPHEDADFLVVPVMEDIPLRFLASLVSLFG